MTLKTQTPSTPPSGMIASGRKYLVVLAVLLAIAAVCSWISLGIGLYLDVERSTRLILAVVAALATEALFWTVAALLGVSVFQARVRILKWLTGRKA